MEFADYLIFLVLAGFAVFGVVDAIRSRWLVRAHYAGVQATVDSSKQPLETICDSLLLKAMYTGRLYRASHNGYQYRQCTAWSVDRHRFTLNKKQRDRNKMGWSVTLVGPLQESDTFLIRPTIVPEAIAYIGDGASIDIPDDQTLTDRYHIVATDPAKISSVLVQPEIREFLVVAEITSVELTRDYLILKRKAYSDKVLQRLQQELDIAVTLCRALQLRPVDE